MFNFLARRIGIGAVTLIGLVIMVFFLARLTGDPALLYLPIDATAEMRAEFSQRHGFDQPSYIQFLVFVRDIFSLEFGDSLGYKRPALDVVLEAFPVTLTLAILTISIALTIAVIVGSLAALKPRGFVDRIVTILSVIGASAPTFWVALLGILIFAVWMRVLPTSGFGGPIYWVIPLGVLIIGPTGRLAQVVRGAMITTLSSAYVKTAKSKGASAPRIIFVHALRNCLLPVITVAGDLTANVLNGAVVIETIFGFRGVGGILIEAVLSRDFAVLQAAVLISASAIFLLNVLIDIAYTVIDPRVTAD